MHVLNLIRWKLQAGPRWDGPAPSDVENELRRHGRYTAAPSAAERERIEIIAWDDWVQAEIWPAARQGYAEPCEHAHHSNNLALLQEVLLAERAGKRKRSDTAI